jgi:hypothetical protein
MTKPPPDKYLDEWIADLNRKLGKPAYRPLPPLPADVEAFMKNLD